MRHFSFLSLLSGLAGALSGSAFYWFQGVHLHWGSGLLMLSGLAILGHVLRHSMYKMQDAYWFGLGYHAVSLSWIGYAFDYTSLPYLKYLVGGALAVPLALQFPLSVWLSGLSFSHARWIFIWSLLEYLRTLTPLGLPWNLFGFAAISPLFYGLPLWGALGVSLLTLWLSQIFFLSFWMRVGAIVLTGLSLLPLYWDAPKEEAPRDIRIRLVQPCIPQDKKWDEEKLEKHLTLLRDLSVEGGEIDAIMWSESVLPALDMGALIPSLRLPTKILLLGDVRFVDGKKYVSLSAFYPDGERVATYNKRMLVPFGEYVPFGLPIEKMAKNILDYHPGSFIPGDAEQKFFPFPLPEAIPSLCMETIFPEIFSSSTAEWIINATNDTWFGPSAGPYQHLHWARIRAAEQGRPFVRVSNNGISAVIDRWGRIVQYIPHDQPGYIDVGLPRAAVTLKPFAVYGAKIFWAMLFLAWIMGWSSKPKKKSFLR